MREAAMAVRLPANPSSVFNAANEWRTEVVANERASAAVMRRRELLRYAAANV